MLVLLALPSVGLTVVASQTFSGGQRTAGTEEIEERAHCNAQRRIQVNRAGGEIPSFRQVARRLSVRPVEPQWLPVASGHRFSNGFLAPMRC